MHSKDNQISLIEYSAFFGSIQIFRYLYNNGVELSPTLWIYAIHGNEPELIHFLEENHVDPSDKTFNECYEKAIEFYHNGIAIYIKDNFLKRTKNDTLILKYINYGFLNSENKDEKIVFDFAENGYSFLLKNQDLDSTIINDYLLLFYAIKYERIDCVKLLLSYPEIDVNIETSYDEFDDADDDDLNDDDDDFNYEENSIDSFMRDCFNKKEEFIFPLHMAIKKGNPFIVQLLLSNDKIDINRKIKKSFSPLNDDDINYEEEVKKDSIDYFDFNRSNKKDYNRFKEEMSPLHYAIKTKNSDIVQLLLNHPTLDVNAKRYKYLSLHMSAEYDEVDPSRNSVFEDYVGYDNELIYHIDQISESALGQAISLLSDNKDVNENDIKQRNKIIELLLNHPKIDINFGKKHDASLLYIYYYQYCIDDHLSCEYHNVINCFQTPLFMLIDKKLTTFYECIMKNPNIKFDILSSIDNCDELNKKRRKIIRQFGYKAQIEKNFDSIAGDYINCEFITFLELAIQKNDIYMIKYFYAINSQFSDKSMLSIAIEYNCFDAFQLLLNMPNIDINLQSKDGKSPLYIAIEKDRNEMVKLLLEQQKININLKTKENETALSIASEKQNIEVVQLLLEKPEIEIDLNHITHAFQRITISRQAIGKYKNIIIQLFFLFL